jgi:hypothetical protein
MSYVYNDFFRKNKHLSDSLLSKNILNLHKSHIKWVKNLILFQPTEIPYYVEERINFYKWISELKRTKELELVSQVVRGNVIASKETKSFVLL